MQWLGHQQSGMVRHYYHLHDQEAQQQMRKVSFVGTIDRHVDGDQNPQSSEENAETISTTRETEAMATNFAAAGMARDESRSLGAAEDRE